ncbi:MAG: hypothetical protein IMZ53_13855, partial [Thermoplasmata archaeon]|nr:hypothetical protein [Thermoplasmata archaeon]
MKIEWDYTNHFINLPIQKGAEESEIRYFADDCEVAVRKLPLSRTCVDSWLCVDLSPFNAKKSYRVEVGLDNLWTRAIFAGREANLEGKDDTRAEPIIHFVPNGGNVESIREILQGKDGKWQLQYFADILGKAKDSIDCITLESPDQLDWRFSHAEYNLPKPTQQDQQELKIWQGAVRQEYFMPFSEGTLTMAVSDELGGDPPATMFSIPLVLQGQNLAPIDGIRKLRIWERHWKNVNVCKFDQKLSFRIAPGHWPNIRILEPEGKLDDISAQAFEIEIVLGCANNQRLHLDFCGFSLDITNQNIWSDGFFIPAMEKAGCLRFTVFIDQGIAEVISGGQAILVRRKNPGKKTINVDNNVSGNVGGCQIEVEPVREIHLESDSEFTIHALIVYGMRSYHYSQEAQHLIDGVEQDSPLFFKGETFAVYGNRVSDTNYGHPDAYLIDNATVVSPVRVTEEFQWRETRWGDMIRVIDRKEIWRPAFDHSGYPRFHSGINSVNATYEIAVDTFAACKSDVYALPGQSGMWAAGLFQGPGEGFGVWVRDSAHIALRCGNLLDPRGARKTLLYTTRNGFDNGPDGPAMAIVGLWDYYLVTHDRNTLMYAWPFLLGKIQQVESRFSKEIGLVKAIQSTSNDAFDEPENGGYCLSTECYFMKAYSNMALMGELLGFDRKDVGHWRFRAKQLKDSINRLYWNDTCGYYTSGPRGSQAFAEG